VRTNLEIATVIKGENIVRFIKSQRLTWYGHINRVGDKIIVKAILNLNTNDKRLRGRPKTRWKDDVEADLLAMKITEWKKSEKKSSHGRKLISKLKPTPGCKADDEDEEEEEEQLVRYVLS
jgi:hypothetical protein